MPPRRSPMFKRNQKTSPFSTIFGEGSRGLFSLFSGQQSHDRFGFFGNRVESQGGLDGITGMISNTQKALDTVQKVAPVIQQVRQYGPLIRNLPSMYKMLKAFKTSPSDDNEDGDNDSKKSENIGLVSNEMVERSNNSKIDFIQTRNNQMEEKKSLPMFFMPRTRN